MQAVGRKKLRQEVMEELRALGTADDFMNEAAAALLGIHTTDMHAGEVLDREGAMTVGELAGAVGLSPGAATALVDRLEDAGFATRVQDAGNRRRVLVQPSKEAGGRAYAVFGPLIRNTATFLEQYSEQELILIRDFLRGAQAVITKHTERLRDAQLGSGPGSYPPLESGGS
jgi:DNA-binding MarR family transcriptional regulator